MKRIVIVFTLLISLQVLAQHSNLVVFAENEEPFTLSVNAAPQNTQAAAHVRADKLLPGTYRIRIKFEDASLGQITKTVVLESGNEYTVVVRRKKNTAVGGYFKEVGKTFESNKENDAKEDDPASAYVIRLLSVTPLTQQQTQYGSDNTSGGSTGTVQTQTHTGTSGSTGSGNVGMNVNVNADGTGFNMSMNVNDGTGGGQQNMSTQVQTTTTTTGSSWDSWDEGSGNGNGKGAVHTAASTSANRCASAMPASNFASAKKAVESKGFDETRLQVAKQVISANCMSVSQVVEVMEIFGFEQTKLDFAKYAYDFTSDPQNYFMVNDVFGFSSSVDALDKYLQGKR